MSDSKLAERLLDIKDRIDAIKTEKAELEGRKKSIEDSMSKKYGCGTIEEAQKLLTQKKKEKAKKITALKTGIEELENILGGKDDRECDW